MGTNVALGAHARRHGRAHVAREQPDRSAPAPSDGGGGRACPGRDEQSARGDPSTGCGLDLRLSAGRGLDRILVQDRDLVLIVELGHGVALLCVRPTPPGARRSTDRRRVT
jgi:hypothetical protein